MSFRRALIQCLDRLDGATLHALSKPEPLEAWCFNHICIPITLSSWWDA